MAKKYPVIKRRKASRVVMVKPKPQGSGRGPVEIFYRGQSFGIHEIDHSLEDPNKCSSLAMTSEGKFIFFLYTLQDVKDLTPEDVPYLIHVGGGIYRHPNDEEFKAIYNM